MFKLFILSIISLSVTQSVKSDKFPIKAAALIDSVVTFKTTNETNRIVGKIGFEQLSLESGVFVKVDVKFEKPMLNSAIMRGIHVHQNAIQEKNCETAGAHWNPKKVNHGLLSSLVHHSGDLGNFRFSPEGYCFSVVRSFDLTLTGNESVVNRSVVIHENIDDGGLGNNPSSILNGNAGSKIACGTINLV